MYVCVFECVCVCVCKCVSLTESDGLVVLMGVPIQHCPTIQMLLVLEKGVTQVLCFDVVSCVGLGAGVVRAPLLATPAATARCLRRLFLVRVQTTQLLTPVLTLCMCACVCVCVRVCMYV
jgi:hypothetical protein